MVTNGALATLELAADHKARRGDGHHRAHRPTERIMRQRKQTPSMPDRSRPGQTTTARPITVQGGRDKWTTGTEETLKLPSKAFVIGTWNVRTLYACGKTQELTHELKCNSWDVIGLSEVRWTGFGETTLVDGHKIWFWGEETTHQYGVAFLVRKEIANCIISATPISSRLISIRLATKPHNITAIQVYAPTSDHEDDEVEKFYEDLDNSIAKVPKKDILILQGDWNAKVGPDAFLQWAGTAGRFGHGTTNERGLRLLEFAKSHSLTLVNTLHPHKRSRTITWHAPNGEVHNQIDYILAPQWYKSSINKAMTRTYPGADIGSDHDLVLATFKLKLNSKRKAKSPRLHFDLEKLKDPNISETFRAQIGGKFGPSHSSTMMWIQWLTA
ncbi:craniofacial development protein 2 [Elysia marginata]|uniref:Craniofacial development protein 2 n=1 Tax=Elysia marginata TaxID=1093978 RepID=A0AAV4ING4_9GAST|nr:craniofacial development protein 2 [Elysia marginata]